MMEWVHYIAPYVMMAIMFGVYSFWSWRREKERSKERMEVARIVAESQTRTEAIAREAFVQFNAKSAREAAETKMLMDEHAQSLDHKNEMFKEQLERMKDMEPPKPPKPPVKAVRTVNGQTLKISGTAPRGFFDGVPENFLIRQGDTDA